LYKKKKKIEKQKSNLMLKYIFSYLGSLKPNKYNLYSVNNVFKSKNPKYNSFIYPKDKLEYMKVLNLLTYNTFRLKLKTFNLKKKKYGLKKKLDNLYLNSKLKFRYYKKFISSCRFFFNKKKKFINKYYFKKYFEIYNNSKVFNLLKKNNKKKHSNI
jgi:hypothetical protein